MRSQCSFPPKCKQKQEKTLKHAKATSIIDSMLYRLCDTSAFRKWLNIIILTPHHNFFLRISFVFRVDDEHRRVWIFAVKVTRNVMWLDWRVPVNFGVTDYHRSLKMKMRPFGSSNQLENNVELYSFHFPRN